jgi:hypothetical protein
VSFPGLSRVRAAEGAIRYEASGANSTLHTRDYLIVNNHKFIVKIPILQELFNKFQLNYLLKNRHLYLKYIHKNAITSFRAVKYKTI